jgi:uncharacterized protein (UPF0332 family)
MKPRDFLDIADDLAAGIKEAGWRSAVSRAYYAVFHGARALLQDSGFTVPAADQAHSYLWKRLSNSGHPDAIQVGRDMIHLRNKRNWADYDLEIEMDQTTAMSFVQMADTMIELLEEVGSEPAIRTAITETMKVYERDVLRQMTWRS